MQFRGQILDKLASMICGDGDYNGSFIYRSSSKLTDFFSEIDMNYRHDGTSRKWWVKERLKEVLSAPLSYDQILPEGFIKVIANLMDLRDASDNDINRQQALRHLNLVLQREGMEAFYHTDQQCYLRHLNTKVILRSYTNPHRPLTRDEQQCKDVLARYLDQASEDEFIEKILLPLFQQLGFQRIRTVGHKDKLLEYGADMWMRFKLPTQHFLYFGIQVKKGKIDSNASSKTGGTNVATVHQQVLMMLNKEIFDSEMNRTVLPDHAFIIAGGEITKAARNWLVKSLDKGKRSQIIFMDRNDILDLYAVTMPLETFLSE